MKRYTAGSILLILMAASGAFSQTKSGIVRLTYNETTISRNSQDQTTQRSNRTVIWLAPDGQQRTEQYDSNQKLFLTTLFNPNTQRATRLDYLHKTATNMPATEQGVAASMANPQDNSSPGNREFLGTRKISGLDCRGTRTTSPNGATVEGWGCPDPDSGQVIFGSLHFWTPNGMQLRRELEQIERLPKADPSLFDVPPGFTVVNIVDLKRQ